MYLRREHQHSRSQITRSQVPTNEFAHSGEAPKSGRTTVANAVRNNTPRIVLYSHDTMGLGHVRRNLLIAQTVQRLLPQAQVLLITGASEATSFSMPPNVDCLTLPRLYKQENGSYRPRQFSMPVAELISMRSRLIRSAVESFKPDLFIVDNVPLGALKELDPVLRWIRSEGKTQCVLGLRDVLDSPEVVRQEWLQAGNEPAIRRFYDQIWIYGDRRVYDSVSEYELPSDLASRTRYAGYLDQRQRVVLTPEPCPHPVDPLNLPPGELIVCLVGGGQDGAHLAESFARSTLPEGSNGLILTGPHMPEPMRTSLARHAIQQPRMRVLEFVPEPCWLWERADRVVTMGGYNSVCEAISYRKPTLVIPRVAPRQEQLIRAERLRDRGVIEMLRPEAVSPESLSEWMQHTPAQAPEGSEIDCSGLDRVAGFVEEMLTSAPIPASNASTFLEAPNANS